MQYIHLIHGDESGCADLLRRLGDDAGAVNAYRRAAGSAPNVTQRAHPERRIAELVPVTDP